MRKRAVSARRTLPGPRQPLPVRLSARLRRTLLPGEWDPTRHRKFSLSTMAEKDTTARLMVPALLGGLGERSALEHMQRAPVFLSATVDPVVLDRAVVGPTSPYTQVNIQVDIYLSISRYLTNMSIWRSISFYAFSL